MRDFLTRTRRRLRNRFFLAYGMRGTAPINPAFGAGLGTPIDRYYIDRFFSANADRVTGRVLEIGDRTYTERFGRDVTTSDVLSVEAAEGVTWAGDLSACPQVPDDAYDCVLLPQTLHFIPDMRAALAETRRILSPGGSLLCTVPGISQVSRYDMDRWGDRWRLTSLGARELFSAVFDEEDVDVHTYGNALAAVCFLQGVPAERLATRKLDLHEPDYELIVAVAATKPADG